MITVPFIYFSLLSFILFNKSKRIDLAVFISICYAILGFFAVLQDAFNMRDVDTRYYQVSITATVIYCSCITLCILPVARYAKYFSSGLRPLESDKFLKNLAVVLFCFFVVFLLLAYSDIIDALTGDMGDRRRAVYHGMLGDSWMSRISNPLLRYPLTLFNLLTGAPWVFVMLAFYCSTVQKMQKSYVVMFFAVSLLGPLNGIMGADRSATTYWIIAVIGCYIMFRPYMNRKQARSWFVMGMSFVLLAMIYIYLMTISRFGDWSGSGGLDGSQLSAVSYLGQNFVNFCFFFDEFESPVYFPGILFPFTASLFGELSGGTVLQQYVDDIANVRTGVFYTFLGQIKIFAGPWVMFLFVLIVSFGGLNVLKRLSRSPSLYANYVYMLVASVSMLGMFGHYYASGTKTFCVVVVLLTLHNLSTSKIKHNNKN